MMKSDPLSSRPVLATLCAAALLLSIAGSARAQSDESATSNEARVVSPRPRNITPEEARAATGRASPGESALPDATDDRPAPAEPQAPPRRESDPATAGTAAPRAATEPMPVAADADSPPAAHQVLVDRLQDGLSGRDRNLQWLLAALLLVPLAIFALTRGTRRGDLANPWLDVAASARAAHPLEGLEQVDTTSEFKANTVAAERRAALKARVGDARRNDMAPPDHAGHDASMQADDPGLIEAAPPRATVRWQGPSAFGRWLQQLDPLLRRQSATEALIYWIAYADDRYPPELRRQLLANPGPLNPHDTIKRQTLLQNSAVFVDSLHSLLEQADGEQREQILDYIGTLLVSPRNVTPVQNTLLRFLADAFELGQPHLQARFLDDFGHELPALPRPDRAAWWQQQSGEHINNWRLSRLQSADEEHISRMRLGIHRGDDLAALERAWAYAQKRCNPNRYNTLNDWERELVRIQREKLEHDRQLLARRIPRSSSTEQDET